MSDVSDGVKKGQDRYSKNGFDESKIKRDADGKFGSGGGPEFSVDKKKSDKYHKEKYEKTMASITSRIDSWKKALGDKADVKRPGNVVMRDVVEWEKKQKESK